MTYLTLHAKRIAALLAAFALLLTPGMTRAADPFTFADTDDGLMLTSCRPSGDTVAVPDSVDGKPVTALSEDALNDLPEGVAVTIPSSVVRMENNPFLCSRASVQMAPGSPFAMENGFLTETATGVLVACLSYESDITVPDGVRAIGARAFYGLPVRRLSLPPSVESIGEAAFAECAALESVGLPDGLAAIPDRAFLGCAGLHDISFPKGLKTIGSWAFARSGLRSAALPEGLTAVGNMAFLRCGQLQSAYLPRTLTAIPDDAFDAVGEAALFTLHENTPAEKWAKENDVAYQYPDL